MKITAAIIILSLNSICLAAQEFLEDAEYMNYLEEISMDEDVYEENIEDLHEDLLYIRENPFNLKTVTKAELEKLPFLTVVQTENLLYHIYKYGIFSIYDLKNVKGLDLRTIKRMLPFVCVKETEKPQVKLKDMLRHNRQEIELRTNRTVQQKAGYKKATEEERTESPNKYYLGEPYYMSLRYRFISKDVLFGFTGEKDAGEAFWNGNHKGFDHYAFNFNLKDRGILKDLHLGDYRLSFGQGLVMNNTFAMGKTFFITNIGQFNEGIKRHSSTGENNHFRGAAASMEFKSLQFTFFGSRTLLDANADSTTVFTFKNDGYNRTPNDIEKRNSATVNTGGGHIRFRKKRVDIGLTAVYYSFGGKRLDPKPFPYNVFYLRAKDFFNTGVSYDFREKLNLFTFQGETAIDGRGKFAALNHLRFDRIPLVEWILSHRYYARDYNAFYARALSESSAVRNENGFYSCVKFYPVANWMLSGYVDWFRFPWLKYGVDSPSEGREELLQLTFETRDDRIFTARYRHKQKSKNETFDDGRETFIQPHDHHNFRLLASISPNRRIKLKIQADYNRYAFHEKFETGRLLNGILTWSPNSNFRMDFCAGYYNTGDYNTRMTVYEKNILYAFSFPSYYGEGFRMYSVIKWKISKPLTVYLKVGDTHYFDRTTIGSDLEAIEGRDKTDIDCLVKYSFHLK